MHYDDLAKHNTLAAAREQRGLLQEQLSKLLPVSHHSISRYEQGNRKPSLPVAIGLELIFGQSLTELYPGIARAIAEQMIPMLQKLSIALEWDEQASPAAKSAILAIGERLSSLMPEA